MVNRYIFLLGLLGLLVSSYLAYEYNFADSIACPITGSGCDIVRSSQYSTFLEISIPYLGIVYYFFVTLLSAMQTKPKNRLLVWLQIAASVVAVIFGIYLTYLEQFIIGAYCFWCVTSFIISLFLLGLVFVNLKDE